jgi:L-seryl-tRNA(Ser) seleniumtransferase
VPHVVLTWNENRVKLTREELTKALAEGQPSIQIGRVRGTGDQGILISVFMLQEGEERLVAQRLRELLRKASA